MTADEGLLTWTDARREAAGFSSLHSRRFVLDGGGGLGPTEQLRGAVPLGGQSSGPLVATDGGYAYSTTVAALSVRSDGRLEGPLPGGRLVTVGDALHRASFASGGYTGDLVFSVLRDGGAQALTTLRDVSSLIDFVGTANVLTALVLRGDGGTWLATAPLDGGPVALSVLSPTALPQTSSLATDGEGYLVASDSQRALADGGTEARVQLLVVANTGAVIARLDPRDGGSESPTVCFNGSQFLSVFLEPLGCCSSRVWSTTVPRTSSPPSASTPTLLATEWVFEPRLACAPGRQVMTWGQWNLVETSQAAQMLTVLDGQGRRASASVAVSTSRQTQLVERVTSGWVAFETPPNGHFLAPMSGQADASVRFTGAALAEGLDGGWATLENGATGLRFERRDQAGGLQTTLLRPAQVANPRLVRAPWGWAASWDENGAVETVRLDGQGIASANLLLPLGNGHHLAASRDAVLVAMERPNVLSWMTTRSDGGVVTASTDYFAFANVAALDDRFVLAWRDRGVAVAWAGEDGQLTSAVRVIGTSGKAANAPHLACGSTSCLLTYLQWNPTTEWDVIGEWLTPDGGTSGPIVLRNDTRSEPRALPVFVGDGRWRLAFDRYEPTLSTRRVVIVDLDEGTPDAGTPDAGTPDAGTPDAGTPDAGTPDAGTPDAGTPDAGTPDTADSGSADAGEDRADASIEPGRRQLAVGCHSVPGSWSIGWLGCFAVTRAVRRRKRGAAHQLEPAPE